MFEPIELSAGVVGMSAIGQVTIDDYTTVVEPALDEVLEVHEQVRLFLYLGPDFGGFVDGAWGELTGEIRHAKFHRGAVVTDDHEIRNALNLLKWMLRGDVRTFQNHEYDEAAHWVAG
ncbi:MAG: STAS/SEC14 domain-containing protein [Ilumatobacteraceae bacterium]